MITSNHTNNNNGNITNAVMSTIINVINYTIVFIIKFNVTITKVNNTNFTNEVAIINALIVVSVKSFLRVGYF